VKRETQNRWWQDIGANNTAERAKAVKKSTDSGKKRSLLTGPFQQRHRQELFGANCLVPGLGQMHQKMGIQWGMLCDCAAKYNDSTQK